MQNLFIKSNIVIKINFVKKFLAEVYGNVQKIGKKSITNSPKQNHLKKKTQRNLNFRWYRKVHVIHVCVCVCVCVCVYMCVYMCVCTCTCIHALVHAWVCACMCVFACAHIHMRCVYMCMARERERLADKQEDRE